MKKIVSEKKHRLEEIAYVGEMPVSFTLCIKDKKKFFIEEVRFRKFEEILLNELKSFNSSAFVYLFMPDHSHLVLAGNNLKANVKKCLEMFKQKSGYWLGKHFPEMKWQKDYYDNILRGKENLHVHLKYILNNPISSGIVEDWKQYLYKGSTVYNLNEWD